MTAIASVSLTQLRHLNIAARILAEREHADWLSEVKSGNSVSDHPYSIAIIGLWGYEQLESEINDVHAVALQPDLPIQRREGLFKCDPWSLLKELALREKKK